MAVERVLSAGEMVGMMVTIALIEHLDRHAEIPGRFPEVSAGPASTRLRQYAEAYAVSRHDTATQPATDEPPRPNKGEQRPFDQRLTNDIREPNANIRTRTATKIRAKSLKSGGPGRTRTSNQTVMSGEATSDDPEKSDT